MARALIQKWPAARHAILSAFVLAYFYMAVVYCLPDTLSWKELLAKPVKPFTEWSGIWQQWNLFSPDPDKVDVYFSAVIWYPNGKSEEVDLPRMDKLDLGGKLVKERWRKFLQDNVGAEDKKWVYPYLARYIAQSHASPGCHPVEIELVKHYCAVPDSNAAFGGHTERKWKTHYFYNYRPIPMDFQQ